DADFLGSGPGSLRYARQFARRRQPEQEGGELNRLYVAEPMPTPTGTKADHRFAVRAGEIGEWARKMLSGDSPIRRDLERHSGASLVIAGEQQPPDVHALAHQINTQLGNVGKTVVYTAPLEANPVDQLASLASLVTDLDAGAVDLLLVLGGNPAFNAPVEIGMKDRLQKAKMRVRLGLYYDETSEVCQWHLPEAHYLEAWGDARAFDGTVTVQQPLIEPLYNGRSASQVLQMLTQD